MGKFLFKQKKSRNCLVDNKQTKNQFPVENTTSTYGKNFCSRKKTYKKNSCAHVYTTLIYRKKLLKKKSTEKIYCTHLLSLDKRSVFF